MMLLTLTVCAVCWSNGEWHERAEKGYSGEQQGSQVPGDVKETSSQSFTVTPQPVEAPQPSVKVVEETKPAESGDGWRRLLVVFLWLLSLSLLFLGVREHLKGQGRR
jgi:hypothetical protein